MELIVNQRIEVALAVRKRAHRAAGGEGVYFRTRAVGIAAHQRRRAALDAQEIEKVVCGDQVGNGICGFNIHGRAARARYAHQRFVRTVVCDDVQIRRRARGKVAAHGTFSAARNAQRVGHAHGPSRRARAQRQNRCQHQNHPLAHVLSS